MSVGNCCTETTLIVIVCCVVALVVIIVIVIGIIIIVCRSEKMWALTPRAHTVKNPVEVQRNRYCGSSGVPSLPGDPQRAAERQRCLIWSNTRQLDA